MSKPSFIRDMIQQRPFQLLQKTLGKHKFDYGLTDTNLPITAQWCYFIDQANFDTEDLASDGYLVHNDLIPEKREDENPPLLMYAGSVIDYYRRIGTHRQILAQKTEVGDIVEKTNKAGDKLRFVTLKNTICEEPQWERPFMVESRSFVFMDSPPPKVSLPDNANTFAEEEIASLITNFQLSLLNNYDIDPESVVLTSLIPSTELLFRYSAVTFNAHKIHYDSVV
eukprot:TRINITY_DN1673_c0_g1_i1.p1 TRINITY_DN1673_c0_g1~~TRINITY_DN1673_c0_g1_i1.p1  ORF type:complete len:237 (-),score=45.39 TRINITY_DN1673_c0_g1_i1:353-1027(-)